MAKIISFKSKESKFREWLKEVVKRNFLNKYPKIKSAVIIWDIDDEEANKITTMVARYETGVTELYGFKKNLEKVLRDLEIDEFLKKNIGNYIQYIE